MDPQFVQDDLAYPAMLTFLPSGLMGLVGISIDGNAYDFCLRTPLEAE